MMVAQPKHGRKLVLSGIALTMARYNRYDDEVSDLVRGRVEDILKETCFYRNQLFSWIGLAVRYGLKNDETPEFIDLDDSDGELALAVEIDVNETIDASLEEMQTIIGEAVLKSVIHAGEKYGAPVKRLKEMRTGLPESLSP